jgi:hypothetical protein
MNFIKNALISIFKLFLAILIAYGVIILLHGISFNRAEIINIFNYILKKPIL